MIPPTIGAAMRCITSEPVRLPSWLGTAALRRAISATQCRFRAALPLVNDRRRSVEQRFLSLRVSRRTHAVVPVAAVQFRQMSQTDDRFRSGVRVRARISSSNCRACARVHAFPLLSRVAAVPSLVSRLRERGVRHGGQIQPPDVKPRVHGHGPLGARGADFQGADASARHEA